jgi:hypothetical protein
MRDPSLPIQKAIVTTLKADPGVATAMGGAARVYDRVPDNAAFPYIQVGDSQTLDDKAEGVPGADNAETVHIWSRAVGKVEAKRIAAAVAVALDADLSVDGFYLNEWSPERVQHLEGGDGLTSHSVMVFRYLTEPAA